MSKSKILIIEDDAFFRELILGKLRKENFDVFAARDSKEGFDYLQSNEPQAIVLDLILPDINGYEILTVLKKDVKTKNIPVIVLSNLGQEEEIQRAKDLGAADFMIKVNFTLEEIAAKIRSVLNQSYI